MTMQAFKNKESIKLKYTQRAEQHRQADEIARGYYWNGASGCCVGCLAHSDKEPHEKLAKAWNVDVRLFHVADAIHEGLPQEEMKTWPCRFTNAIPVGADLSLVWPKFVVWLLTEEVKSAITDDVRKPIETVAALHQRWIAGDMPSEEEFASAASAAASAARGARGAWAAAAAAWAASAAARAAAAAASAASAAASAARGARGAWPASYQRHSAKLIELIEAAT